MRAREVGAGLSVLIFVAGCAATDAPPRPSRPAVPEGWFTRETDEHDLRLTLPPELDVLSSTGAILAQEPMTSAGIIELEVWASAPSGLSNQPEPAQPLADWLTEQSLVPRKDGVTLVGETSTTFVSLPSGEGVEVRTSVFPGRPEESVVVVYAIRKMSGVAVIRFVGRPERLEERADDLDRVVLLAEFGS
jgi:hypothetical protein